MKYNLCILSLGLFFSFSTYAKPALSIKDRTLIAMNRLGFGARPGEVESVSVGGEKSLQRWIDFQLNPEKLPDTDLENHLAKHTVLNLSIEELQEKYNKEGAEDNPQFKPDEIRKAWASAKIIRAVESQRQFQEKLVDFWFNHFNVDQRKGKLRWSFGTFERDAIRPHIFGKFSELLRATARHPAMLFYLDNHLSRVENKKNKSAGINENYARELMELHTLSVDGGYNQNDIKEVARVLTGWSIAQLNDQPVFEFKEKWHDFGSKKILNWDFPENQGELEGEKLLSKLSMHPSTARHISKLLIENFVTEPAPKQFVDFLARKYLATDGDLKAVYRAMIESKEFWDPKYANTKIKDHFDWTISVIRELDGEVLWQNQLVNELNKFGEPLYQCAPPTGYTHRPEDLVNSGTLVSRLNLSLKLAANRIDGVYVSVPKPKAQYFTIDKQVLDFLQKQFGIIKFSKSTNDALASELAQENWHLGRGEIRPFILARLVGLLLASPEFQRM